MTKLANMQKKCPEKVCFNNFLTFKMYRQSNFYYSETWILAISILLTFDF